MNITFTDTEGCRAVLFYSHRQDRDNWPWSNFADFPIYYRDEVWRNSEAAFQADKFIGTDEPHRQAIRQALTPHDAAAMGRDRNHKMRADWEAPVTFALASPLKEIWQAIVGTPMLNKDWSMLVVVGCKLKQHPELDQLLMDTHEAVLIEHTKNDSYWGDGGDGSGKSMLGKILMVRRERNRILARRQYQAAIDANC